MLQRSQISEAAQHVLHRTSARGGSQTVRQQLRRDKALADAGVAVQRDSLLYRQQHVQHGDPTAEQRKHPAAAAHPGAVKSALAPDSCATSPAPRAISSKERAAPPSSESDSSDDGGVSRRPARDLSAARPPVSVTFSRKPQAAPAAPSAPSDPSADDSQQAFLAAGEAQAARAAKAAVLASGEVDARPPGTDDAPAPRLRSVPPLGPTRTRHIARPAELQEARAALPIVAQEHELMEAVDEHDVVIICGETGCGKTTQVPQFLLEAGFGCAEFPERAGAVGVTQPRRVAAVSTATRVAAEVGGALGGLVGYQVRHDREAGRVTAVKFMTDGILMREVQDDFLLRRCAPCVCGARA